MEDFQKRRRLVIMQQTSSAMKGLVDNTRSATLTKTGSFPQTEDLKDREPRDMILAYRLLWFTFILFFASTIVGKLWDRIWHLTYFFDTFWSLPHFFIFVMTTLTGLLALGMACTPRLRIWFGPTLHIPLIPFPVPGSLVILGAGLIALSCTIQFDNFWHSVFGLDETQWSAPHDMLTWCWLTIIVGFVSARLAFRPYRPPNWVTQLLMAIIVLQFLCPPILGPFYLNYTPSLLHAMKNMTVVRAEPTAQHMYRIYLHFGITRLTCAIFIPIAALFAGVATAFLHRLDRHARIFFAAPLIWSLILMVRDLCSILFLHYKGVKLWTQILPIALKEPSLWVPIPLFVAVIVYKLLYRTSFTENRIYVICGMIFGLCTYAIWHVASWEAWLVVVAGLTMLYGSWIGKWLYHMLEKPTFKKVMCWLLTTCVLLPVPLGLVDLCLRWATPW
jgi:hypothetical protein